MPLRRRYAFRGGGVTIEEFDEEDEPDYDDEEEAEDTEEEDDDTEEEDEESQIRVHTSVPHAPMASQEESEEKEKQIRSAEGVCSTSGSQEEEEDAAWKPSEGEGTSCLICMEVWTNGGDHQVWYI